MSRLMHGCTKLACSIISSAAISNVCGAKRPSNFAVIATALASFTLFEARSINFAIVVYAQLMHVEGRLALSNNWGSRRATWPRKRRRRRQRRQPRRKRSNRRKPHGIRI